MRRLIERLVGVALFIAPMAMVMAMAMVQAATAAAQYERRVALVIGNSAYVAAETVATARRDAEDMGRALRDLGFQVMLGLDLDRTETTALLDDFGAALDDADVGLIYFTGHAVQAGGTNYLLPVDAAPAASPDLDATAIAVEQVLAQVARDGLTGLVILDAVSDNAVARNLGLPAGLAAMSPPPGVLIALGAAPGQARWDGAPDGGAFTTALLSRIDTPQISVEALLDQVADDVRQTTAGAQLPQIASGLVDPFTFDPDGPMGRGTGSEPDDGVAAESEPLPPLANFLNGMDGGVIGGLVGEPAIPGIGGTDTDDTEPATAAAPPDPLQAEPEPMAEEVAEDVPAPGEGGSAASEDIAVSRYPVMDLPDRVLPGERFALMVWLSRAPVTPEVETTPGPDAALGPDDMLEMTLPAGADWTFRLVLNAPGFRLGEGGAGPVAEIAMDADGDSSPALWLLTPEPGAHPDGEATLSATLWHGATYLARFRRTIAVGVIPAAAGDDQQVLEPPTEPVSLDAKTQTADLTVRVDYADPAALGPGQVIVASPHFRDPLIVGTIDTPVDVAPWLDQNYRQFVAARHRDLATGWRGGTHPDGPDGTAAYDGPITEPLLRGFGRELWRRYAPDVFKQALWTLVDDPDVTLETIQIYSNNPVMPWELMRPFRTEGDDELEYLGVAFQIARWHAGDGAAFDRPLQVLAFDELVAIAPHYDAGDALGNVSSEIAALRDVPGFREVPGRLGALRSLLDQPPRGIIHFAGHGVVEAGPDQPNDYAIKLEDLDLNVMAWRGLSAGQADDGVFYFFNACDVGRADYVANFVEGWAPAVLEAGAAGFIGGLWPVFDDSAADFAARFYGAIDAQLSDGPVPVAAVLQTLRARFAETGDPTWLSYVYYGDVNLRLVRE